MSLLEAKESRKTYRTRSGICVLICGTVYAVIYKATSNAYYKDRLIG